MSNPDPNSNLINLMPAARAAPAVARFEEVFQLLLKRAKVPEEGEDDEDAPPLPTDALLLQDTALAQLADPDFAADAVRFVVLEARPRPRTRPPAAS
jgi:hypothetical protein